MAMMESTLDSFAAELASAAPTPGGGGAAALAGALAAALGNMVGNLTVGKKKYADNEPRLKELNKRAEELRVQLLEQIDADAENFRPLSQAYGIPKDDPTREETLERCLHAAAEPPMQILRLSAEAAAMAAEYAALGSKLVVSDAGCAAAMAEAAVRSAALNVIINTRLMKDREFAEGMNRELHELMDSALKTTEETYKSVYGGLL